MAREKRKEKAKLHQLYNLKVSFKKKEKKKKNVGKATYQDGLSDQLRSKLSYRSNKRISKNGEEVFLNL